MPVDRLDIAQLGRRPEGRVAATIGVYRIKPNPDDDRTQDDRKDEQRQQDAFGPMLDQPAQPALPEHHRREKTAD